MTDIEEILLVLTSGRSGHRKSNLMLIFYRRGWRGERFNAAARAAAEQGLIVFNLRGGSRHSTDIEPTVAGEALAAQVRARSSAEKMARTYAEWDAIWPWDADGKRLPGCERIAEL